MPAVDKAHPEAGFIEVEPLVIGAVDLVFVIIAALAMLVVGAGWIIGWLITTLLGGISILGFRPFQFLGDSLEGAMAAIARPLISRLVAFGHAAWSITMVCWRFVYVVTVSLAGLAARITGLSQSTASNLATLQAREDFFIGQLRNDMENRIATLGLNVLSIEAQLQAKEATDVANLNNRITADDAAINNRIVGGEAVLANALNRDIATVEATLQSDVLNLNNRIVAGEAILANALNRDVNSLTQADANTLRTAENFATGLVSGLGVGTLRTTLTALQSQVSKIATETTECLDPLCNTVTPQAKRLGNLGKHFQDLETLGIEALLIALAAECMHDPAAVATDISTVVNAVGGGVMTGFRDLIGA